VKARIAIATAATLFVGGCVMTPGSPNLTLDVQGDYLSVADCSFVAFQKKGLYFSRADLESMKTVRLNLAVDGVYVTGIQAGYIDFIGNQTGRTHVVVAVQEGLAGQASVERNYGSVIRSCAAPS
jgi:hypothetical protein